MQQGKIDGQVGLCARVGLYVGIFGAEEAAGPLDGNALHLVDKLAAAIIALAGQSLGIFVGEHAAHGGHHRRGDNVFAGNQLNVLALANQLPAHGGGNVGIDSLDKADAVHHFLIHGNTSRCTA